MTTAPAPTGTPAPIVISGLMRLLSRRVPTCPESGRQRINRSAWLVKAYSLRSTSLDPPAQRLNTSRLFVEAEPDRVNKS